MPPQADGINRLAPRPRAGSAMRVSVVYCAPDAVWSREIEIPAGTTLRGAIECSGVLAAYPALRIEPLAAGIFGHVRDPDTLLHDGNRVEVYRGLRVDPKEARRHRAALRRRRAEGAGRT
jgi:putative ubiquitin-RnfH superfamily antitoxin RatB of RatAB toxin-antitoxin module